MSTLIPASNKRLASELGGGEPSISCREHSHRMLVVLVGFLALAAACSGSSVTSPPPNVDVPTGGTLSGATIPLDESFEGSLDLEDRYQFQPLSNGAGGFVTGVQVRADGEYVLARTDVGGAFKWTGDQWEQLLSESGVENPVRTDWLVSSLVSAPSDPDRIYLSAGGSFDEPTGRVLYSSDRGNTWEVSDTLVPIHGNANGRTGGERLSVDPGDANRVWLATRTQGLLVSNDGAQSFESVDGLPLGHNDGDPMGVTFVLAGESTVWVGVANEGVFASTDRGKTWERVVSNSGIPGDAELDSLGRIWVSFTAPGALVRIDGRESLDVSPKDGEPIVSVAVSAVDPSRAVAAGQGIASGRLWRTTDGGESWNRLSLSTSCPGIPWLDSYANDYLPVGSISYDVRQPDLIWIPEGFAMWRAKDEGGKLELKCASEGIEELVPNDVIVPPGGVPVTASWDRGIFWYGEDAPVQGPTARFNSAWDLDWTPADDSFVAAVVADHRFCCEGDGGAYQSGYSLDGGRTWQKFASYDNGHPTDLRFGNIAISAQDVDNIVWLPTFNKAPYFTTDRGASWTEVRLPGTESMVADDGSYSGGSHFQYYLNRHVLVADRVAPLTFYLYHRDLGLFRSVDGGKSWVLMGSKGLATGWTAGWFNASLKAVPASEGALYFAPGLLEEGASGLYYTSDGGDSWELVPHIANVTAQGFGIGPDSTQYFYAAGEVGGKYGVWRSTAGDLTGDWALVSPAPLGNYQQIKALTGDQSTIGTIFVGFSGSSYAIGEFT